MARICDICLRGTQFGNTVSHSHHKERRTWKINLVKTRIGLLGSARRASICTRCLRSGFVDKPVKRNYKAL